MQAQQSGSQMLIISFGLANEKFTSHGGMKRGGLGIRVGPHAQQSHTAQSNYYGKLSGLRLTIDLSHSIMKIKERVRISIWFEESSAYANGSSLLCSVAVSVGRYPG
jgi:hypothetical protein